MQDPRRKVLCWTRQLSPGTPPPCRISRNWVYCNAVSRRPKMPDPIRGERKAQGEKAPNLGTIKPVPWVVRGIIVHQVESEEDIFHYMDMQTRFSLLISGLKSIVCLIGAEDDTSMSNNDCSPRAGGGEREYPLPSTHPFFQGNIGASFSLPPILMEIPSSPLCRNGTASRYEFTLVFSTAISEPWRIVSLLQDVAHTKVPRYSRHLFLLEAK